MGTYSTWEFYETFGGWPEPGETYPDDPDAARDEFEASRNERDDHGLRYSVPRRCDRCEFETVDREAFWQHDCGKP